MKVNGLENPDLTKIIKNLEELVLASTGAEPFEEILKLIYVKLFSEKYKVGTDSTEDLFEKAKISWPGFFEKKERIELTGDHLSLCMKELSKIEIYKTDLEIVDTAFEHLLPKAAKGSRGQYFTPRYIIKEIVKVLNPKSSEFVLDPACGSGGFLLHAARYTGGKGEGIYGVDFDSRMVRIAKMMMVVGGFEKVKIVKANFLDKLELDKKRFDVIVSNPPFGGEIREEEILDNFEMARDGRGRRRGVVERHLLFIERIVKLLKPGGRAAIVVPQGILNNTNLEYVREWIYKRARVVGVVGLDINTFKPFTNVKTSLLFLQKWKGKPKKDYKIFMAVSERSGKNLSGDLVLKAKNQKKIIDTDLREISEELREFIEREDLGF